MPAQQLKVLLAIDNSKHSEAALRMVMAQHKPGRATVRVLHVVEPIQLPYYPELTAPYPKSLADIQKQSLQAGRRLVRRAAARLRAAGFAVETTVRSGHVRSILVEAARKWRADLIVVGSRGRKGLERILLGSVSDYVARHAPCSVQIVRPRHAKG
jgi:nucleotide-binding universal stress UspA family protein